MVVTQTKNSQLVHKVDTEWAQMKNTSLTLITRDIKAASLGLAIEIRLLTTPSKRSPVLGARVPIASLLIHPEPDAVERLWTFFYEAIPSLLNNVLEICLGD